MFEGILVVNSSHLIIIIVVQSIEFFFLMDPQMVHSQLIQNIWKWREKEKERNVSL